MFKLNYSTAKDSCLHKQAMTCDADDVINQFLFKMCELKIDLIVGDPGKVFLKKIF